MITQKEYRHQNALLRAHRCGWCAESVSEFQILRASNCPHCLNSLHWHQEENSLELEKELWTLWHRRRWMMLIVISVASFLSGQIPMLQSAILLVGLIVCHIVLIRRPLRWFPIARRLCAKLTIQLWASALAFFNIVMNALVAPFVVLNGFVLAVLSIVNLVLYVHLAFSVINRRLEWESQSIPFGPRDWGVPVACIGLLIIGIGGIMTGTFVFVDWLMNLQFPGTTEIADWLSR